MNKINNILVTGMMLMVLALPTAASAEQMMAKDIYKGVDMMMMNKMEFVALRQVAMKMGYTTTWNPKDKYITLTYTMKEMMGMEEDKMMDDKSMDNKMMSKHTIKLMIGSKKIFVDGKEMMLDVAPIAKMNTTYVTKAFVDKYLNVMMQ